MSSMKLGLRALAVAVLAASPLVACSSGSDSESESSEQSTWRLEGRYDATSFEANTPFQTVWFSRDGRYHAWIAGCTSDACDERGTFKLDVRAGKLVTTSDSGLTRDLRIALEVPKAEGANSTRPQFFGDTSGSSNSAPCVPGDGTDAPASGVASHGALRIANEPAGAAEGSGGGAMVEAGEGPIVVGGGQALIECASELLMRSIAPGVRVEGGTLERTSNRNQGELYAQRSSQQCVYATGQAGRACGSLMCSVAWCIYTNHRFPNGSDICPLLPQVGPCVAAVRTMLTVCGGPPCATP
jgi:hypothetical protein